MNKTNRLAVHEVPRFTALDGPRLERLMAQWLSKKELTEITIVSLVFDPRLNILGRTLSRWLELHVGSADITIVTSGLEAKRGSAVWRNIGALARSGIRVLVHEKVHAKIYLFKEHDRGCWIVGSANMTKSSLENPAEVCVRGFHSDDYTLAESQAKRLIRDSWVV